MPIVTCTQCGGKFKRPAYHVLMTKNPFCGFACYGAWQKEHPHRHRSPEPKIKTPCITCGAPVERTKSKSVSRVFCNRKCVGKWRSVHKCGENSPTWRGGSTASRGPNWQHQAAVARDRDSNTCCRCGLYALSLHVHHIRPFHLFDDYRKANELSNLVTLCPGCHRREDAEFWRANPDLRAQVPINMRAVACVKCHADFVPNSGAHRVCLVCCSAVCVECNKLFVSRRCTSRTVKYCGKKCRNAAVARKSIGAMPRVCVGCGIEFRSARAVISYCTKQCSSRHGNGRSPGVALVPNKSNKSPT